MTNKEGESLKPLAKSANSQELMISFKQWIWCKHCYCYSLHATSVYRCSVQELYWLWVHSGHTERSLREHLENTYFTCGAHPCPETGFQYFPKRIVSIKLDTDINRGLHDVFLVRCQKGPFGGRSSDSSICFRASHLFPMVRVSSQWQWQKI